MRARAGAFASASADAFFCFSADAAALRSRISCCFAATRSEAEDVLTSAAVTAALFNMMVPFGLRLFYCFNTCLSRCDDSGLRTIKLESISDVLYELEYRVAHLASIFEPVV